MAVRSGRLFSIAKARKLLVVRSTVEPPNNGQVGAGGFVRYSEVSFIGRLYHIRLRTPNVFIISIQ